MTYQVIARKWRPQSFDEVTGQEAITRTLRNAIEHQRLHHAYLFSGARGVGKTTTARLLAKALNCHKSDGPTATPCRTDDPDICASCRDITECRSPDVREIDAASNTGVDNVRNVIIDYIAMAPAAWEGKTRYTVYIIDEVHMLSTSSFNALLKTIEEPPPRVVFIMATTERHKVPETILSRCQQFEFRTIATAKILDRLRQIAKAEKIDIEDEALREIARSGEGSMRDAQSGFDQVISFAGAKIKKEDVEMALGVAGADTLVRVINGIANHQPSEALAVVDDVVMRGHDLRNFCRDLLAHFRDLLVTKVSANEELLESAICDQAELKRQAELFSEADLVRFFHSLAETETLLKTAAHPRYQLEVGLVKLMEMRRLEPLSHLMQRLGALEDSLRTGKPLAQAKGTSASASAVEGRPGPSMNSSAVSSKSFSVGAATRPAFQSEVAAPVTTAAAPLATSSVDEAADTSEIGRIKSALEKRRKMFLVTLLEGARQASVVDNEFCVEFAPEGKTMRDTLAKSDNVKILREVCKEVTGADVGIRFVILDPQAAEGAVSKQDTERHEKQSLRETAEKDPVVQQMLKTFRGEIVDVRRVDRE